MTAAAMPRRLLADIGATNALVLAGGLALVRFTRYQMAGRALALLACLVVPLNLWFYHRQDLITVQSNLWVAALVCCVIYAVSASVLRDPMFVYVLVGGVALILDMAHLVAAGQRQDAQWRTAS